MKFGFSFLLIVLFTIVALFGPVTTQKPFPTVPQDFTCIVEVTHVPNKETRTLIEWYDTVSNIAKIETHRHNDSIATIYKNSEQYNIDYLRKSCRVHPIENGPNNHVLDPSGHVSATRALFHGTGFTYTYLGQEQIRGIWVDKWLSNVVQNTTSQGSYQVQYEYWFAVQDWRVRGFGRHVVPVRVYSTGSFTRTGGPTINFNVDYNFVSFLSDIDGQYRAGAFSAFRVPIYCLVEQPAPYPEPTFPSVYHAVVQITDEHRRHSFDLEEYYDFDQHQRERVDFRYNLTFDSLRVDHQLKFSYILNMHTDRCHQIPYQGRDHNFVGMMTPSQMYAFTLRHSHSGTLRYYGQEKFNGIDCDKWGAQFPFGAFNVTSLWFFASSHWHYFGSHLMKNPPVGAIYHGTQHNGQIVNLLDHTYIYEFSEFTSGHDAVPEDAFMRPRGCLVTHSTRTMPTVSQSYYLLTQYSNLIMKMTVTFEEWFDATKDRVRYREHTGGKIYDTLGLGSTQTIYYHETDMASMASTCKTAPFNSTHNFIISHGDLRSAWQLMNLTQTFGGFHYAGSVWVRGIYCHHWYLNFTGNPFNQNDVNSPMYKHWTYEMFFTHDSWKNPSNVVDAPVRAILTGYEIADHERLTPTFERSYDFSNYIPGPQNDFHFNIPIPCPGAQQRTVTNDEFGASNLVSAERANTIAGIIFGVGIPILILGFFIGVSLAFFGAYVERKRSPQGKGFSAVLE